MPDGQNPDFGRKNSALQSVRPVRRQARTGWKREGRFGLNGEVRV